MSVTLYYLVVPDGSTAPTGPQVVAGVDYGAVTVLDAGSVAYSGAGTHDADSDPVTGASASTTYDQWWVASDGTAIGTPVSGEITTAGASLDLDPAAIALSGALAISGDIQIGTSFDLAADPVALSGSLAVSGDIESSVDPILDIDAAPVALAGSLGISGDIQIGTSFDLAASAVALAGSLSVSGEIQSSTEPIIVARGRTSGGGLELFIDEAIEDDDEVIEIMQVLVAAGVLWEV
jgi:hypothetical protein